LTEATLEGQYLVSALHQASYLREKELVALDSGKRTTVGSGGFFVYRQQITRRKKGSQEDPLIFFQNPSQFNKWWGKRSTKWRRG
ncbi:hypothetical protein MQC75_25700, partial [Escherichia coli]|nr:hypothetical protein [Escherichia coli]